MTASEKLARAKRMAALRKELKELKEESAMMDRLMLPFLFNR